MTGLLPTVDFSTLYIDSVTDGQAQALRQTGIEHAILGYDSSAASANVRAALVRGGLTWSAYRLPIPGRNISAQVDDTLRGIHASDVLPRFFVLDIEPTKSGILSIAQIEEAMDAVEAGDILPSGTLVKPVIYSAPWVWDAYYSGYTGPAERDWYYWGAGWLLPADIESTPLAFGFPLDRVIGHQYAADRSSPIGTVDLSVFLAPVVETPTSGPDIPDLKDRLNLIDQAIDAAGGSLRAAYEAEKVKLHALVEGARQDANG